MNVGDQVISAYGEKGKVVAVHDRFSAPSMKFLTMTPQEWLAAQKYRYTEEQLEEKWLTVEIQTGTTFIQTGSIMGPISSFKPAPV